ncbi:MAG TPA: hypothetical protein VGD12_02925 [Blastococcus sp.]|jgi:hypothetical protein
MNAVHHPGLFRRAAVLLLLTAGLVVGAAFPSWASFTDAVSLSQMTVTTPTLEVPGVPTARATCVGTTATVTVTWNASAAPRVSGYRVRLYLNAAWQDVTTVTGTTWTGNTSTTYVTGYAMTFTVWTLTPYGWTAESVHTARVLCA